MKQANIKIAILIYSLAGGGAERVVSYLIPYLQKRGLEVHLVLMNTIISYELPQNTNIHYLEKSKGSEHGIFKLVKLPFLAYRYAKLLKHLQVTHSFALLTRPSYINILSRYFTAHPYQLVISERSHPSKQYGYGDLQSKINNILIKKLYPKADRIICNSKGNSNDLIQNYAINPTKIKVVHNPIDIEKIEQIEPETNYFNKDIFNIVTIGRMDAGKNHQLLIRAVSKFPEVQLYILGDGLLKPQLEQLAKEMKLSSRITFLGFDNNPYRFLKGADLFMFGSNHEGFPNVLLEAMCCGLPILTSNCKSGPDEIMELQEEKKDDIMITKYGILTPVGDLELMQKGLAFCFSNREFLDICRENVLKRTKDFEKKQILHKYLENITLYKYSDNQSEN